MYVLRGLLAINQRNNVWMVQAFEDSDLGGEVVFELFVELRKVDRFDCHEAFLFLLVLASISNMALPKTYSDSVGENTMMLSCKRLAGALICEDLRHALPCRLWRSSLARSLPSL